ncbi:NRDE family protein [Halocatena salina]|uniref:NRDE family protein n=1 Tax=Halocatena salina TaxID=2934340 RepID=A0A8U0A0W1_9EURY|nr:NRDE family protein [Halocatena salina]UPM42496.1 NRDE family protein [Halocatena salina]
MCTLIIAWQVFEKTPILLGANRDELYDRPSHPPRIIDRDPQVLAPIDEESGGTWIGYNENGVVAAITNGWVDADLDGERSRGLLVRDALERQNATAACRTVERELDTRTYDAFNLLVADENSALLIEYDGRPSVSTLSPGVHVVMNVGYDTEYAIHSARPDASRQQAENGRRLYEHLQPRPAESAQRWHERVANALSDHEFGVCIHGDGFGTRSSSLIRIDSDGRDQYAFADGPPCRTDFERIDEQLASRQH